MVHSQNGLLELPVYDNTVSYDDNVIEDYTIIRIMQRCQTICKPGDTVGLTGTSRVLDQIIQLRPMFVDRSQELTDQVKLMIAREDQRLRALFLARRLVHIFLSLDKDELRQQIQDRILGQNILPHVGYAVSVLEEGIAGAGVHARTAAHIEGQKHSGVSIQLGGHIDFIQVHGEVYNTPCLEAEQTGLGIPRLPVLQNSILIGLPGGIALQLKGHDGESIQENDQIDSLVVRRPNFLHHRQDVGIIQLVQRLVESSGGLGVHQVQMPVIQLNTAFEHFHERTLIAGHRLIDDIHNSLFCIAFEDLIQLGHHVRLRLIQKLKQHPPVDSEQPVKISSLADTIAVLGVQIIHDFMLILFLGQNIIHDTGTSFFPVTYS